MIASTYNTIIDQGADWYINFVCQDPDGVAINIIGGTASLQLRSLPDDPTAVLSLTTENNGITITGATGLIAVHATATQTNAIITGIYYYDLELNIDSTITRIIQGQATVSAQVTR
jgi:hypothetical protein